MARLSNIKDEEWQNRVELAACYHLTDHFNMSDIIWNHITAKTSSEKDTFLINKFGLTTPKELILDNLEEKNLFQITKKILGVNYVPIPFNESHNPTNFLLICKK